MLSRERAARRWSVRALAACVLAFFACSVSEGESGSGDPEIYRVRGVVELLEPDQGRLKIRHEAIPTFRDASGEVVGMDGMAMWFGIDDDAGLAIGDALEFELRVDWSGETAMERARVVSWRQPPAAP